MNLPNTVPDILPDLSHQLFALAVNEKRFTHLFPVETLIGNRRNLTSADALDVVDKLMTDTGVVIEPSVRDNLVKWLDRAQPGNIFIIEFLYQDNTTSMWARKANEMIVYER